MNRYGHIVSALASACLLVFAGCSAATDSGGSSSDAGKPAEEHRLDPSVQRTPKASRSLTLAADWQPPAPTRTQAARLKARVQPQKAFGVPTRTLGAQPTDADLRASMIFSEPLRPVVGTSTATETDALASALREPTHDDRGVSALQRFTEAHPQSRWAPAIHLHIGAISYGTGYFQDALAHWKAAWELAKAGEDDISKELANQALAEYAKMNARIGRMTEVASALTEAQGRTLMGDARVKIESASEGLWAMQNRPGISFQCGPYALLSVAQELKPDAAKKTTSFLARHPSPTTGFSLPEVQRMSSELGLTLQLARRDAGAVVIVPAVVHWKLGHFGALVRERSGTYVLKDPTFGNETSLSRQALDEESSGYFLVPAGPLPAGWKRATTAETAHLYGRGYTVNIDPDDTSPDDPSPPPQCPGAGPTPSPLAMATYRFHILAANLHIEDTPVAYATAVGPSVRVNVAYNHREAGQPTTIDFTSFGPQFVSNWVSYLVDNPTNEIGRAHV